MAFGMGSTRYRIVIVGLSLILTNVGAVHSMSPNVAYQTAGNVHRIAARTCKQVVSCEDAVALWCSGYRRADADDDGIPCENICHSREQVDDIRKQVDC